MLLGHRVSPGVLTLLGALALGGSWARAQGPTIDTPDLVSPGGGGSTLGRAPGAGGAGSGDGQGDTLLGGRAGTSTPKGISSGISRPGQGRSAFSITGQQGFRATLNQAAATIPVGGSLGVPDAEEDPGPPDGLTLDQAINRLVRENLDLRSQFHEIPQAKADELTASLRANPVFYADAQLVPYGQYTRDRPGGQTQYDVNISYPLDLSRKRAARTVSAKRATAVIEAQYQDAVRKQIDNLYSGYIDVLQARRTIAFAEKGLEGLINVEKATIDLKNSNEKKQTDIYRAQLARQNGEQQVVESHEALLKAKRALAAQLNIPAQEADGLEVNGVLKFPRVDLPSMPELVTLALGTRQDVIAYRLGVARSQADVKLAYANRFQDVYVLYQPYTLQDNTPFGLKSPTSWAIGVTIPLPIYNRNQGNIERAKINVSQTQTEAAAIERAAIQEVQAAEREYLTARRAVDRIEVEILPKAKALLDEAKRLYPAEVTILQYLEAIQDYNDNARSYLDASVRLRRAMLDVNTAVGQRLMP